MPGLEGISIESALAANANREAAEKEVGQADFLQLLVAQLENQDPLNPQDSAAFAAQLAQFSSVEQLVAVRAGIDQLVARASEPFEQSNATASSLDPASLVGMEVVVFGSQIEVDAQQSEVVMPFRSVEDAIEAEVVVRNAEGVEVYRRSIVNTAEDGSPTYLPAGDHQFRFDPRHENLRPGVYAIEFTGVGSDEDPVTLLPTIEGLVSGAILVGDPSIRIGSRIFSVSDVLEVRLPGAPGGSGAGASSAGTSQTTGGGQSVLYPSFFDRPVAQGS